LDESRSGCKRLKVEGVHRAGGTYARCIVCGAASADNKTEEEAQQAPLPSIFTTGCDT